MQNLIIREGEEVPLPQKLIARGYRDRLLRISDAAPFRIFRLSRGVVRAGAVVGTVTCGSLRIEIQPKTADGNLEHSTHFLLNLLHWSGYLRGYYVAPGLVAKANVESIETLIAVLSNDIAEGLRSGGPRRYEMINTEAATIRGRIDFNRLSVRLPTDHTRTPIRYAPLSADNRLTTLIKWVARSLLNLTKSSRTKDSLCQSLLLLHDVSIRTFSKQEIEQVALSRFEVKWLRIVAFARILVDGKSFDPTRTGGIHGSAFVFPLERLFERCLRQMIARTLVSTDLEVDHHTDELYMLNSDSGQSAIRIRPDYVYRRGGRAVAVADAKWKLLKEEQSGFGVSPADVYQMSAYLTRYQLRDAFLFFPRAKWMLDGWFRSFVVPGTSCRIHIIGVDIESLVSPINAKHGVSLAALRTTTMALIPPLKKEVTTS